jgi:hypothetical protein
MKNYVRISAHEDPNKYGTYHMQFSDFSNVTLHPNLANSGLFKKKNIYIYIYTDNMMIKALGNQRNDNYHIAHLEDTTSDETHTVISEVFWGI